MEEPKAVAPQASTELAQGPLGVPEATELLRRLSSEELKQLASSSDVAEQLPARMGLEYVGDKDLTWGNAQKSLKTGTEFVKEMLEIEGGITRGGLGRMDELGTLDLVALQSKNRAACVLALFIDAWIRSSKERLGLNTVPVVEIIEPTADEKPPEWPLTVDFKDIQAQLGQALRWKKTPLLICDGHAKEVNSLFTYTGYANIDAKWIIGMMTVEKKMTVEEIREHCRVQMVSAMKNGRAIFISMSNSACPFKDKICAEEIFPATAFNNGLWYNKSKPDAIWQDKSNPDAIQEYKKIIRESDLTGWTGVPGQFRDGFYTVVTTDFSLDGAKEHLPNALPYFHDMALIHVNPASFAPP